MKILFPSKGPRPGTVLFILFFCFFLFPVFAQEGAAAEENGAVASEESEEIAVPDEDKIVEEDLEVSYIEMDIRTSTLVELAAWCREVGLNDGGSREELATRLRRFYELPPPRGTPPAQRVITIESAKTTEYFTLEVVDEEYARLRGDVIISLKDGSAIHRIQAWEILYNRTRNVMSASGDVVYTKQDGNTIETFKGSSITVNLDNWSSIFMDGASEKTVTGKTTAYRFSGTIISRNTEEVTVLQNAEISNASSDESYWSLHASKLWLLPGNDWAILNAVLKVGNVPLLYIPAFFYPADEIVFHPVLGVRSREGTFLQTTTYILGKPRSSSMAENSLTEIFGGGADDSDKKRVGVFLRTTGEKTFDPRNIRLSLLFDAYTNLGAYLGSELTLPAKNKFGETTVSLGLGLTRNIYTTGGNFTPFGDHTGDSDWNSSRLFFVDIPLRYRLKVNGSYKATSGSLSWEIPYYSDPYVDRDFMKRSETLDWLGMLREGVTAQDAADTSLNSYEWRLNGSFVPPIPNLRPYVSSFSISSLSSSLLFSERISRSYTGPVVPPNPGRAFFFPNRFTIYSLTAAIAGTPYTSGDPASQQNETEKYVPLGDAMLPDLPISPWGTTETETFSFSQDVYNFSPPALNQRFSLPSTGGANFTFDYRLTPTTATELQFRSSESNWREPENVNWGEISSILTRVRGDGSFGFNLNHQGGGAYSGALRLNATGSYQGFLYLNEGAEEFSGPGGVQNAKNRAYADTLFTSSWDFSSTVRPFYQNSTWSKTSFQYSVRGLLAKTNVDTTTNTPKWDWVMGKWDKTDITSHQATANFSALVMDYSQDLSIVAVLPPKDSSISGNATFRAWISETSLKGRVAFPFDEEERKIEPVYFTETLRFTPTYNFSQYIVYDPDIGEYTTFTSSFNFTPFTASFSATYTQPYKYNYNGSVAAGRPDGWIQLEEKSFVANDLRLAYNYTFSENNLWGNRLSYSFNVITSMNFDLQQYTRSMFSFGLALRLGISKFLDMNLSSRTENSEMFKYFQALPFFDMPTKLYPGQETNIFIDLLNSFRFDDEELRRRSGFKLKMMNLSLVHHLGDWDATLSMNMTPYLPPGSTSYKFDNEISFMIQWIPIREIRTNVEYIKEYLIVR